MGLFDNGKSIKVRDLFIAHFNLQAERKELCTTLKGIRGKKADWRDGIEDDKRTSVKLLYKELQRVENDLSDLEGTWVTEAYKGEPESPLDSFDFD